MEDEENRPLWDGESEIHVRQAVNEEADEWEKSHAKAILAKEVDDEDDEWLVFLIPVIDVTDEEDDDDDEY